MLLRTTLASVVVCHVSAVWSGIFLVEWREHMTLSVQLPFADLQAVYYMNEVTDSMLGARL